MTVNNESVRYSQVNQTENPPLAEELNGSNFISNRHSTTNNNRAKMSSGSDTGSKTFLFIAASAVNLIALTAGISFGWTSPVLPKLSNATDDPLDPANANPLAAIITKDESSWIGSLLPVGAAMSPFLGGIMADKIGRKYSLLISGVPFLIAFILSCVASEVIYFFILRFLCGVGVGIVFCVLPMYVGEIAEDSVRGALGSLMQLFITFGLLFSYAIGPYVTITWFSIMCLIIPAVFMVTVFMFIPESPYYLVGVGKMDDAEDALKKLRGRSDVQKEITEIKAVIEEAQRDKVSFMDIFQSKGLTKALILSMGLVGFQQFSGINVILFYTADIFNAAGSSSMSTSVSAIIIGLVQVLASFVTPSVVDRLGRRFLLLFSAVGMAVSQAVLGTYFYLKVSGSDVSGISWLPVASLVVYMAAYCVGFGPLPWAVMGELFPSNVKSSASTATASFCWILGFLITKFFQPIADAIGTHSGFWIFALLCVVAAVFVFMLLPETKGKSLQEIQSILNGDA